MKEINGKENRQKRRSGVLLHISSLPGPYGCGSFGRGARQFVDFLAAAGFTYWQVLPFAWPDDGGSPYKSVSAFAGNPYFIDLDELADEGLLIKDELVGLVEAQPYVCDFDALQKRFPLYLAASRRVNGEKRRAVFSFVEKNPRLESFCHFMAKREANGGKPFRQWDSGIQEDADLFFMHCFLQYTFFTQWKALKRYANEKGVLIIGDMPIYVDVDSADVYEAPENFLLDEQMRPTLVAGVPPDYFAPEGQLWGNPIYNWERMKEDGYAWWQERMAHTMKIYDGVRIDHFRAFSSYYALPAGAENAKNGKWYPGPGLSFVKLLKKAAGRGMIIAEDLGDIDDDVRHLVEKSGLPGMRVFQFGFDGEDDYHRPHAYPENCVAYSGTHDNNTLLGYLWECDENKRRFMLDYCGYRDADWTKGLPAMREAIFRSHAGIVIFPLQDLLGYGADTRMNVPGVAGGSWRYRVSKEQLASLDPAVWDKVNRLFGRRRPV